MARKPISLKLRFEIFKRDGFKCQYCGNHPPAVTLEVDHIHPHSKSGKDNLENLLTSCFDCNRGKSDRLLTSIPKSIRDTSEEFKERESQLKEYQKLLKRIDNRKKKDISSIDEVFRGYFEGKELSPSFKESIKSQFIDHIPAQVLSDAMEIACVKIQDPNKAVKYFCGIAWGIIKGDGREKRRRYYG